MMTFLCAAFAVLISSIYMACVGITLLEQQGEQKARDSEEFPWHYIYLTRPLTFILELLWGTYMFIKHGIFCVFSSTYRDIIIEEEYNLSKENDNE